MKKLIAILILVVIIGVASVYFIFEGPKKES